MAIPLTQLLNAEKALIFRITHRSNVRWILEKGIHARSSDIVDPNFVTIGSVDLIEKRRTRIVDHQPGGTLEDYVAFYFTPFSPMLFNIKTGHSGIRQRSNDEIVFLVSSLQSLEEQGVPYLFTDRHAYLKFAKYFSDRSQLTEAVDYPLLQKRDFTRDEEHPERFDRYQAEALAYRHVPMGALLGLGCYTSTIKDELEATCSDLATPVSVVSRPEWYFQ